MKDEGELMPRLLMLGAFLVRDNEDGAQIVAEAVAEVEQLRERLAALEAEAQADSVFWRYAYRAAVTLWGFGLSYSDAIGSDPSVCDRFKQSESVFLEAIVARRRIFQAADYDTLEDMKSAARSRRRRRANG
jgi:hypothetical protein